MKTFFVCIATTEGERNSGNVYTATRYIQLLTPVYYGKTKATIWWRHQMKTFSALLAICVENSPVTGEFPSQRPMTRSFDFCFDPRPNKRLSKQSWGWWFETLSCRLWRHCNDISSDVLDPCIAGPSPTTVEAEINGSLSRIRNTPLGNKIYICASEKQFNNGGSKHHKLQTNLNVLVDQEYIENFHPLIQYLA